MLDVKDPMVTPRQLLEKWIDAFNAHDVDALRSCYAEEAVNHQVSAGEPAQGKEEICAEFGQLFSAFPDIYAKVENVMVDGDWAAWEWTGGGTFEGKFLGHAPTGHSYTLKGCGFFRIVDGRIQEHTTRSIAPPTLMLSVHELGIFQ